MDNIKLLMSNMLTEREIMIFMLISSGMSQRDLATRLQLSHENVRKTYKDAQSKIDRFAEAGFFSSPVDKKP